MTFSPTIGRNLQALNPLNLVHHHPSPGGAGGGGGGSDGGNKRTTAPGAVPPESPKTPQPPKHRQQYHHRSSSDEGSTRVLMSNRPSESHTISEEVDRLYKDFEGFQSKLKTLVGVYKDQNKLMTKLNEQRLEAAKCYSEMFGNSPLQAIVTEKGCTDSLLNFATAPPQDLFPDVLSMKEQAPHPPSPPPSSSSPPEKENDFNTPVSVPGKDINTHKTSHAVNTVNKDRKGLEENDDEGEEAEYSYSPREMIEETTYPDPNIFRHVKIDSIDPDGEKQKHDVSVKVTSRSVSEAMKEVKLEPEGEEEHGRSILVNGSSDGRNGSVDADDLGEAEKVHTAATTTRAAMEPEGEQKHGRSIKINDASVIDTLAKDEEEKGSGDGERGGVDPPITEYPHDEVEDGDGDNKIDQFCNAVEGVLNVVVGIEDDDDDDDESEDSDHSDNSSVFDGVDEVKTEENDDDKESVAVKKEDDWKDSKAGGGNVKEAGSDDEILAFRSVDSFSDEDDKATNSKAVEVSKADKNNADSDEPEIVMKEGISDDGAFIDTAAAYKASNNTNDKGVDKAIDVKSATPATSVVKFDHKSIVPSPVSVSPVSPVSHQPPTSYYDIHSAAHSNSEGFLDQHKNLVNYLEEWENTVSTRVKARHGEFVKFRKNLSHYIKKVDSLKNEHKKLEEKNKPIKPKQEEKLERNILKLSGARETHDQAGESLILLLDEIVHRSWKDVYPLLTMAMRFEMGYAAMQAKIFERLDGTLVLLADVGEKESISVTSRLEALRTMNPEVLYTGHKVKDIGLPVLVE